MKTIVLSFAFAAFSIGAMAQSKSPAVHRTAAPERVAYTPEVIAQRQTDRLSAQVGLTAAQKTKVNAIYMNHSPIRANAKIGEQGVAMEHNDELMQELNAIMTPEQKKKYIKVKAEEKAALQKSMEERSRKANQD